MTASPNCHCRHHGATIQTVHIVHGRTPGRALQISVAAVGHEARITVLAERDGTVEAGGFIELRDVRRVARALTTGTAKTYLGLRPWQRLPGGRLCVEQDGEDVYLIAAPIVGPPELFGPLPAVTVAAMCRDVVGWNRLLARNAVGVAATS